MKRISLLCLWLCAAAWATGCCHSYYSRYADCDDGYGCCSHPRKTCRHRRCKGERGARANRGDCWDDCCGDCYCDQCCDGGIAGQSVSGAMPVDGNPMMMPNGGCAGGNCAQGVVSSGCASGNCGSNTPMYGGMPFNPGDGWTIQSTTSHPIGNEPVPAPGSSVPTPVNPSSSSSGWTTPSSVPTPAPVPPPVSFNRK